MLRLILPPRAQSPLGKWELITGLERHLPFFRIWQLRWLPRSHVQWSTKTKNDLSIRRGFIFHNFRLPTYFFCRLGKPACLQIFKILNILVYSKLHFFIISKILKLIKELRENNFKKSFIGGIDVFIILQSNNFSFNYFLIIL